MPRSAAAQRQIERDERDDEEVRCSQGLHNMHEGLRLYDGRGHLICRECSRAANRRTLRLKRHPEYALIFTDDELRAERLDPLRIDPPSPGFKGTLVSFIEARDDWMSKGVCAKLASPDAWMPDDYDSDDAKQAINACYECPVMLRCATYATVNGEEHGIWGGTTPEDRGIDPEIWNPSEVEEAKRQQSRDYFKEYRRRKPESPERVAAKRERQRQFRANMTPEQREAQRAYRNTPEQKAQKAIANARRNRAKPKLAS